jgi:carnitine 3-dehydrogenase
MTRVAANRVRRVASLGGGPIGGGWTAHFLARGYDVVSYLHDPGEEESIRKIVDVNIVPDAGAVPGWVVGPEN